MIILPGQVLMHHLLIPLKRDESALFPLFQESSKSVAMIRHGLDIKTADYLTRGQLPVIALISHCMH